MITRLSGFKLSVVTALVVGAVLGPSPWASVIGLLVVLSYELAERYLQDNLHDETRAELGKLQQSYAELKNKQTQFETQSAFRAATVGLGKPHG